MLVADKGFRDRTTTTFGPQVVVCRMVLCLRKSVDLKCKLVVTGPKVPDK